MEPCKHEKVMEKSRLNSGPTTVVLQSCANCTAERYRSIFNLRLPGMTVLSDDAGPWVEVR